MAFNPLDAFDPSKNIAAAQLGGQKVQAGLRKGKKFLKGGQGKSVKAIETKGYEIPRADITASLGQALPTVQQGAASGQGYYGQGLGYIDQATGQAVDQYGRALDLWSPIAQQAGKGAELYGNFFGLGGPEGQAQAQANWQGSPLYNAYSGQEALLEQALNRQAAQRGNPYNATDIMNYGGQLAGQYLGQYTAGLAPYLNQQLAAAQGAGNVYGNLADIYRGAGTQKAGIAGSQADLAFREALARAGMQQTAGQNLADISRGAAGNLSNIYQNTATQLAGNAAQQGQAAYQTQADINAARNTAAQNQWNAILGLTSAVASAIPGGGGSTYVPMQTPAPSGGGGTFPGWGMGA